MKAKLVKESLNEWDNYNYPEGADGPDAPWNQDDPYEDEKIIQNTWEVTGKSGQCHIAVRFETSAYRTNRETLYDMAYILDGKETGKYNNILENSDVLAEKLGAKQKIYSNIWYEDISPSEKRRKASIVEKDLKPIIQEIDKLITPLIKDYITKMNEGESFDHYEPNEGPDGAPD